MKFTSAYFRCLYIAISRHYDTEAVKLELVKMGWKEDSCRLLPEVIERSIEEMTNTILHDDPYPYVS